MIERSFFVWGSWASQIVTTWPEGFEPNQQHDLGWGALGHIVSSLFSKGLKTEIHHVGGQLCICDRAPIKTLDTKVQVSFPGWQYSVHVSYINTRKVSLDSLRRRQWKLHIWNFSWTPPHVLPLADFNVYPLAVMNSNHEYNSFQ